MGGKIEESGSEDDEDVEGKLKKLDLEVICQPPVVNLIHHMASVPQS